MAKLLLGISGRVEEGETLSAVVWNTGTASAALTGFSLQWQVSSGGTWVDTGAANALTLAVPAGTAAVGRMYRLVATPLAAGDEVSESRETARVVADGKGVRAPTLADLASSVTITEGAPAALVDGAVNFDDGDNNDYGGGSLVISGGVAGDVFGIRQGGTGAGQIGYNAATEEVTWSPKNNQQVVIGRVVALMTLEGESLVRIDFNTNATKAAVDRLIESLEWSSVDDSPTGTRLFTLKVTDSSGGSVQRVVTGHVAPVADAPVFSGPASYTIDEHQTAVTSITALDPDREPDADQGIAFSLVAGTGSTDNAAFAIDAASGALRLLAPADFEAAHGPSYSVRVRASDSNGGVAEQVVWVHVRNLNEAPVAQALTATAQEDGPAVNLAASFEDPDAGDTHLVSFDATGTVGRVTQSGNSFRYDPNGAFGPLAQGMTATDSFSYTVRDAGGLASTRTATVTIVGNNDAAIILAGGDTGSVREDSNVVDGKVSATGRLTVFDPDVGESRFVPVDRAAQSVAMGTFSIDAVGNWRYEASNAALQPLGPVTGFDEFSFRSVDGTASRTVRVTWQGANDAPQVTDSTSSAPIREDGAVRTAWGSVTARDVDRTDLLTYSGSRAGLWGQFSVDPNFGNWSYQLTSDIEGLRHGQVLQDGFEVTVSDPHGATAVAPVTVTIIGANDEPVLSGPQQTTGEVREAGFGPGGVADAGVATTSGQLSATDADTGDTLTWTVSGSGQFGSMAVDASGRWTYTLDNDHWATNQLAQGMQVTESFVVTVRDAMGLGPVSQSVDIVVRGNNDAPVVDGGWSTATVKEAAAADGTLELARSNYHSEPLGRAAEDAAGRLLVIGQEKPYPMATYTVPTVQRLHADGTPDASFAQDGAAALPFGLQALFVVPDHWGRTLVVGTWGSWDNRDIAVVRLLADGSMDASFGSGGLATLDLGGSEFPSDLLVGTDGRLVVSATTSTASQYLPVLARLNADGTPDASFGSGGKWVYPGAASGWQSTATLDDFGHVYFHTVEPSGTGGVEALVERWSTDGVRDTGWGTDGLARIPLQAGDASFTQLVPLASGEVLIASAVRSWDNSNLHVSLARARPDGSFDTTFGNFGKVETTLPAEAMFDVTVDAQGRIVLAGSTATLWGTEGDFVAQRFFADGSRDTAFGNGGLLQTDAGGDDRVDNVLVTADGGLVLGGSSKHADGSVNEVLARYDVNGLLDTAFGAGSDQPVTGSVWGSDPDMGGSSTTTWTGGGDGQFGTLAITPWGQWSYLLDSDRPATAALQEGQLATDSFQVSIADEWGAATLHEIVVTVVGSWDAA